MADALVSAALVLGGILIAFTSWYWLDPVLSIGVAIVILFGTWQLMRGSLRLSLDGVPEEIDLKEVKEQIVAIKGIRSVHHMHVWAMSTTENAMTVHLILDDQMSRQQEFDTKHELRHRMEHMNIHHVTIETESQGLDCGKEDC
jgi:cobalt-zinc-cadmium efflux system protein